jgi:hypothetical protein
MAGTQAQSIVDQALALLRTHAHASALDILDLAMTGQHGSDPNFEAPPGNPFSDWTDRESPFGRLLGLAFRGDANDPDAWERVVMPGFAERYQLWGR